MLKWLLWLVPGIVFGSGGIFSDGLKGIVVTGKPIEIDFEVPPQSVQFIELEVPGDSAQLVARLERFFSLPWSVENLSEIKSEIVAHYHKNRCKFMLVSVPEQDITDGVVQIVVTDSSLGEIQVEGARWTSHKKLLSYINLSPGDPISERDLVQKVSFINRNPFRRVDLVFAPGKETATTDLILATRDRFPLRVYAGSDNMGIDRIGRNRWYSGFNWGNCFGLDHILSYQFTSSYSFTKFHAHTAEYIALLPCRHVLEIYGGYSQVRPPVSYPFKRNDGWSMNVSGRYIVPLRIFRYLEHEITAGGDFKRSNNTFEFSEDFPVFGNNVNLTQFVVGYSGNYERNNFRLDFKGDFYWSPGGWLSDQSNSDYDSLRPGAVNHWLYFRGAFTYLQRLPYAFSLSVFMEGQVSTEPLLPSEQFGLGGYSTVRGYEQREINKDDAVLVSTELRSPAIPIFKKLIGSRNVADALQFLGFFDYGWGMDIVALPGQQKTQYLMGAGPGIRYTLDPYLTARLDWGFRLHRSAAFSGSDNMIHFNATLDF